MNILIYTHFFLAWAGGTSLIAHVTRILNAATVIDGCKLFVILPKSILAPDLQTYNILTVDPRTVAWHGILRDFFEICPNLPEVHFCDDVELIIKTKSIDIVAPSAVAPNVSTCCWTSYIFDFQHQYYPQYFSAQERANRDLQFRSLIENTAATFVNSKSVEDDLIRFYPGLFARRDIFRFPTEITFSLSRESYELDIPLIFENSRYFISCSQRWIHKQHDLIIKGFELFCERYPDKRINLVFTGSTKDYRDTSHEIEVDSMIERSSFRERINVIGFVSRNQQLALISKSIALVQASLFEGGSGASGMLEAAALHTPIIASDIPPNREFHRGIISYFPARDPYALAGEFARLCERIHPDRETNLNQNSESISTIRDQCTGMAMLKDLKYILENSDNHKY